MKKPLVALVLAGGIGKRFSPLTTNKVLFPFFGKPLLSHVLPPTLFEHISKLVLVGSSENYEALSQLSYPAKTVVVKQDNASGMADAILAAKTELTDCELLVINGDDVVNPEVPVAVVQRAHDTGAFGVIPGWKVDAYRPLGYLRLDGDRIVDIVEKPGAGNEPSPYVNLVTHFIADSNRLLVLLETTKSESDDVYELTLSSLMKSERFLMHENTGYFATIKYPWHVLDMLDALWARVSSHKGKDVVIKDHVIVEGDVYIGDRVKICENTKIVGPTYIGDDTIIGNNNIIRASHIGSRCVTGFNSDITRSYVGDDCWFHSNYIGDSVLEHNVSMGAGSVLANFRLDEGEIYSVVNGHKVPTLKTKLGACIASDVRIGVNTSVMPRIKIGGNSCIGAGIVIDRDISENQFVIGKSSLSLSPNSRAIGHSRKEYKKKL